LIPWRNLGKVAFRHRISPPGNPARVLRAWPGFLCQALVNALAKARIELGELARMAASFKAEG